MWAKGSVCARFKQHVTMTNNVQSFRQIADAIRTHILEITISTIVGVMLAIVLLVGDAAYDQLLGGIGKRGMLSLGLVLFLTSAISITNLIRRPPRLLRRRSLYYQRSDRESRSPLCPHCYEVDHIQIHLEGPVPMHDKSVEYWRCHNCHYDYGANPGDNFRMSSRRKKLHMA